MAPTRRQRHTRGNPKVVTILAAVVLGVLWYLNELHGPEADIDFTEATGAVVRGPATTEKTKGGFTQLNGCLLLNHRNNDGDSFHIRHGGNDYEFRLYYVDCPEKRRHQYNGDRISEQGAYFGGLDEKATVAIGEDARDFTLDLLRTQAFTVFTRWEKVYNSGRFYAFLRMEGAGNSKAWLHEMLVSRGFSRIHTKGVSLPTGTSYRQQKAHLRELEAKAKKAKFGAWH